MIISSEQYSAAYEKLPYPIREYLVSSELGETTIEIGKKYGLHIDTVGALDREVNNMLLGLINPSQFVGELKSVGIPEASVGPIVEELNAKVFVPLREKMKNPPETYVANEEKVVPMGTPTVPALVNPAPVAAPTFSMPVAPIQPTIPEPTPLQTQPVPPVSTPILPGSSEPVPYIPKPAPTQAPTLAPTSISTAPFAAPTPSAYQPPVLPHTPVSMPPTAPAAPATPPPAPAYTAAPPVTPSVSQFSVPVSATVNPLSVPTPVTPPENVIPPHVRTMAEDMRMSQANPQPAHLDPAPLTAPVRPPAYTQPPVRPLVTPAPVTSSTPTQSTPVSQPSTFVMPKAPPTPMRTTFPSPPAPQAGNRDALHAVLKEYGVDPYREPAE